MSFSGYHHGRLRPRRQTRYLDKVLVIALLVLCVVGTRWRYVDDAREASLPQDVSHGLRSFSVHILTCASPIARRDCNSRTARDVKDGPAVYGQLMCNVAANKMIARDRMELVGPAGYLKIACDPEGDAR